MKLDKTVVLWLCVTSVSGIILPMTKTDGTLDVSSLMSHIALLEQTIEDKASVADMAKVKSDLEAEVDQLKSDLAASNKELSETKTKLTQVETKLETTTDELKATKDDLKKAEIEIVVLKTQFNNGYNTSSAGGHQKSPNMTTLSFDVSHLKTDVSQLKTDVFQIQSLQNKTGTQNRLSGSALYTRWGRTSCPVQSSIVYKGYTGGTYFGDKASSASILCLPDQPIYGNHSTTGHDGGYGSHIYGTEYEFYTYDDGIPFKNLLDEDMPCVVCESNSKSNAIMVPGRNQCYPGWTLEYSGYLMGPSFQYASGEYICVDSDAEAIPGGHDNRNGQVLYPVEGRCGSLPCPPYQDHWELSCAVCSK